MQLEPVRAAARAFARQVSAISSYLLTKRCRSCQNLLGKRAMVCPYCRKWQA